MYCCPPTRHCWASHSRFEGRTNGFVIATYAVVYDSHPCSSNSEVWGSSYCVLSDRMTDLSQKMACRVFRLWSVIPRYVWVCVYTIPWWLNASIQRGSNPGVPVIYAYRFHLCCIDLNDALKCMVAPVGSTAFASLPCWLSSEYRLTAFVQISHV